MGTTASEAKDRARGLYQRLPSSLRAVVRNAREHHTLTLAAGLAFFGILSIGPAVGLGFGLLRMTVSAEAVDGLVDLLEGTFTEQLGLADLLGQMEDQAGRYAGIGLVVLLWPATTLASGWTRALDAVTEAEAAAGVRGLRGRVRGLVPGGILVATMLLGFAAMTFGTALAGGDDITILLAVIGGAVVAQFVFILAIYRWLPSERRPFTRLWAGAILATLGVVLTTVGFALALMFGEGLAEQYPPSLTTAIVIGIWLYAANGSLLLGAEYNEVRAGRGGAE